MVEECFVCCEPGGHKRCSCNTVVHDTCLLRMMATVPSHNGECPVCRQKYLCVTVRQRKRCKLHLSFYVFAALYGVLSLEILGVLLILYHIGNEGPTVWIYVGGSVAACQMLATLSLHYFHLINTNRCCCWQVTTSHVQRIEMATRV